MAANPQILEIRRGAETKDYPLVKQSITIGRAASNDVVLTDPRVSRYHARLEQRGGALFITDLKSTNGTVLNGRKLEPYVPYQISEGDVISLGDVTLIPRLRHPISTEKAIAGVEMVSGQRPGLLRTGWFLGVIAAVLIAGIGATLWYFHLLPFVSPSITKVKDAVVLVRTSDSFGSGVIISKSGYVLTCNHILKNDSSIKVKVLDSAEFEGKVIARDELRDLAIVKIDTGGFSIPRVTFGDSDKLSLGQELVVIGYPLGLKGGATVSKGILSAFRESEGVHYIQTDAPFNLGNAGGPLVNSKGQVVGIMTAKVSVESVEGMAFAIAINDAKQLISGYR